ncbi:hypothetical protein RI367_007047 [Sorochytrium milnesiophthora]
MGFYDGVRRWVITVSVYAVALPCAVLVLRRLGYTTAPAATRACADEGDQQPQHLDSDDGRDAAALLLLLGDSPVAPQRLALVAALAVALAQPACLAVAYAGGSADLAAHLLWVTDAMSWLALNVLLPLAYAAAESSRVLDVVSALAMLHACVYMVVRTLPDGCADTVATGVVVCAVLWTSPRGVLAAVHAVHARYVPGDYAEQLADIVHALDLEMAYVRRRMGSGAAAASSVSVSASASATSLASPLLTLRRRLGSYAGSAKRPRLYSASLPSSPVSTVLSTPTDSTASLFGVPTTPTEGEAVTLPATPTSIAAPRITRRPSMRDVLGRRTPSSLPVPSPLPSRASSVSAADTLTTPSATGARPQRLTRKLQYLAGRRRQLAARMQATHRAVSNAQWLLLAVLLAAGMLATVWAVLCAPAYVYVDPWRLAVVVDGDEHEEQPGGGRPHDDELRPAVADAHSAVSAVAALFVLGTAAYDMLGRLAAGKGRVKQRTLDSLLLQLGALTAAQRYAYPAMALLGVPVAVPVQSMARRLCDLYRARSMACAPQHGEWPDFALSTATLERVLAVMPGGTHALHTLPHPTLPSLPTAASAPSAPVVERVLTLLLQLLTSLALSVVDALQAWATVLFGNAATDAAAAQPHPPADVVDKVQVQGLLQLSERWHACVTLLGLMLLVRYTVLLTQWWRTH